MKYYVPTSYFQSISATILILIVDWKYLCLYNFSHYHSSIILLHVEKNLAKIAWRMFHQWLTASVDEM